MHTTSAEMSDPSLETPADPSLETPAAGDEQASTPPAPRPARRAWLWALLILPPAAVAVRLLALGASAGLSVRPAADDWCTVGWIQRYGLMGMVGHYYAGVNGRLANGAAQAVVYADGLRGARVLPFCLIVALAAGSFALLYLPLRHLRWRWAGGASFLLAVVVSALTFFAGNVVYQAAYWPAGTVSHTLPAVLGIWNVALALVAARGPRRWPRVVAVVSALITAFSIGTLSEPFLVVSGVYAAAALAVAAPAWRDGARFPVVWSSSWIVGLVAGFVLLYVSPGMEIRAGRTRPQPALLSVSGLSDVLHGWQQTWTAIGSQPAYYAAVAAGLLAGLLASGSALRGTTLPFRPGTWTPGRKTLALVLPAGLVVVASFAVIAGLRQGYGINGWTYQRAWTNFLVPALLTGSLYGAAAGYWLGRGLAARRPGVAPAVVGALIFAAALSSTVWLGSLLPANTQLARAMTARAQAWGANDAAVHRQVRAGRRVVGFTPNPIAGSTEPFTYTVPARDWVARCAAGYYGVDRLVPARSWLSSPASATYRARTGGR